MTLTVGRIRKAASKWRKYIQEVVEDSEVFEVVLKSGYHSTDGETAWVFGKENLEGSHAMGATGAIDDLKGWLANIEPAA